MEPIPIARESGRPEGSREMPPGASATAPGAGRPADGEGSSAGAFGARAAWPRTGLFCLLLAASVLIFMAPLRTLLHYPLWGDDEYDKYSYLVAIPFLSAALVFLERDRIFAKVRYGLRTGILLLCAGVAILFVTRGAIDRIGADNWLSIQLSGLVIFWLGGFVLCFGARAFREGAFPLLFLFLAVPLPDFVLDKPIALVRYGSADVCSAIFGLSGVPVLRNGLEFALPDVRIRVATECSGIHSTLAILIVSLVAGHLFLPSIWKRVVLIAAALPIVCFTNGLRIAGLTLLAEYVNRSFLFGNLHRKGGVIFFLLALLLLTGLLKLMQPGRGRRGAATSGMTRAHAPLEGNGTPS